MEEKEEATSSTTAAAETEAKTTAAASGTTTSLQRVGSQASLEQASPMSPSKLVAPAPHHYHYIQYPAHYHQQQQMQLQPPIQQPASQCQCPCSCGRAPQMTQLPQQQQQQPTQNGSMAVAVLVHQQASVPATEQATPVKTQSAQSLLNHSYQALHEEQQQQQQRDRLNLQLDTSVGAGSCDCDLECSCAANGGSSLAQHKRSLLADAMLGADEITVSESDNNSTMIKKKKPRSSAGQLPPKTQPTSDSCNDIYHDTELDGAGGSVLSLGGAGARGRKSQNLDDNRPPLPPRPPPRPRSNGNGSIAHRHGAGIKKYVVWCLICGGFSCLLGVLFLGVYFLLHSYTITVGNFETVPTFVPATLLILTGICIMSLARRRNRYSYLIKLSGACGLVSALTCALVTVTTTVLHMSRLQALRECEYAQKTRTCTCYSDLIESQVDRVDKGVRLVFDSLSDCGVVHGSLYSCLRAIFGLSVAGVLIAVFSCMLVYQLLSHERKKMYWEQLELRCRSLYASQAPPPSMGALGAPGRMLNCRCCEQCHAHRQMTLPMQTTAYPWDEATVAAAAAAAGGGGAEQRFWASQPPGNFYSPNPGGDDASGQCRGGERGGAAAGGRSSSGWSWPRMPWQRTTPDTGRRFRQAAASPDSQYGFSSATAMTADGNQMLIEEPAVGATYNGMPPPNALPYGVWGPPPPYSDPNSPARRGYYQYLQPTACLAGNPSTTTVALTQEQLHQQAMQHQHQHQHSHAHVHAHPQQQQQLQLQRIQGQSATLERMDGLSLSSMTGNMNGMTSTRSSAYKSKVEYENTPSDSDGGGNVRERDRCSNTLPTRKLKKRIEAGTGAKSIGPQSNPSQQRPNVQQLFAKQDHQQPPQQQQPAQSGAQQAQTQSSTGVENSGYQDSNGAIAKDQVVGSLLQDPAESEVYFADVSSCCNMSVKNDNYYDNAHRHQGHHHHQHQHSNCSHSSSQSNANTNSNSNSSANEDYLAQRFGRREHSIRSRLPIPPQARLEDDYESSNLNMPTMKEQQQQQQQLQKEISRQSMCSVESEAKTEFTDLSPSTPCGGSLPPPPANFASDPPCTPCTTGQQSPSFVASFPYSSESQCLEAHRRSTKNIHELLMAGGGTSTVGVDSHYEVINDRNNPVGSYQLQRAIAGGSHKHKSKSKTRSREQLDIYGSGGGADRSDWSSDGGRL
ncbi:uncharacterized protein LOC117587099 isoform X2 [Drosophila guanche]|uniref:Uncharacterized protein n=1 Tax=Drosophila guanche TaxID=7266 RepID=A0A3B0KN70_DROGU|nr:uncharacterized protein LOC117587099 isoform X2 [Drosophila guanche]SPP85258.1 Hypothetical predicted protein [Drosophila guanche]